MTANHVPPGWPTVTPRIFVDHPEDLVAFIRRVFRADGETQHDRPTELRIGDSVLMVSGTQFRDPFPACLYVYVPDTDAVYHEALEAGADAVEPPVDTPYGDRRAVVNDPSGNAWQIATRLT